MQDVLEAGMDGDETDGQGCEGGYQIAMTSRSWKNLGGILCWVRRSFKFLMREVEKGTTHPGQQ